MTIAMPDSIYPQQLPAGYPAYLGYVDGEWPTAIVLEAKFPSAKILTLTVTGATTAANGCDIETGDLTPASGAAWAKSKLTADPGSRPVLYASRDIIGQVVTEVYLAGLTRSQIRLLSAHWGQGMHICGPATCGLPIACDGTQWTDKYSSDGASIDMSELHDNFFDTWQEIIMQQLPTVKLGDAGQAVRTVQGLCTARDHDISIDGIFGIQTRAAVMSIQDAAKIPADGIVGPQTWPVLLGLAP